jgi:hypothetical protein
MSARNGAQPSPSPSPANEQLLELTRARPCRRLRWVMGIALFD